MTEREELALSKLIASYCVKSKSKEYTIINMFALIQALDNYYKNKNNGQNTKH